jgi:hypothetical protein
VRTAAGSSEVPFTFREPPSSGQPQRRPVDSPYQQYQRGGGMQRQQPMTATSASGGFGNFDVREQAGYRGESSGCARRGCGPTLSQLTLSTDTLN